MKQNDHLLNENVMEKKMIKQLERLETALKEMVVADPFGRMRREVEMVGRALAAVRSEVLENGFATLAEEIVFFKSVKPRFHSLLILAKERFEFERHRPVRGAKELGRYCRMQLDCIGQFFGQYALIYEYYRMQGTELDEKLFLRENVSDDLSFVGLPEIYPVFATYGEFLFSKFMALEKLREEILEVMLVGETVGAETLRSRKGRELRWTGDTVNLIEVVYGLFDTKQLNDGQVDLSDIMEVFEQVFQVNLSRYFRRFSEIKRRKTVSKTRYLDSMVEAVNRRIDEGDAYVPAAMR